MLAPKRTRFAAIGVRRVAPLKKRFTRFAPTLLLALLAGGCGGPPPAPTAGPNPASPHAAAPSAAYHSTLDAYVSQRPVEPAPWREPTGSAPSAPKP